LALEHNCSSRGPFAAIWALQAFYQEAIVQAVARGLTVYPPLIRARHPRFPLIASPV